MRLLCLRTVFRPPVITIGGNVITADRIQSARLIRTAENMPIKGIVQSELIVALKTDLTVEPNALVTVKTGGEDQLEFSEHFISRISRRGGLLEIHAMDRMRVTENDFDDSLYNRSNEPYVLSLVLADLASQCGFDPVNVSSKYKDLYDLATGSGGNNSTEGGAELSNSVASGSTDNTNDYLLSFKGTEPPDVTNHGNSVRISFYTEMTPHPVQADYYTLSYHWKMEDLLTGESKTGSCFSVNYGWNKATTKQPLFKITRIEYGSGVVKIYYSLTRYWEDGSERDTAGNRRDFDHNSVGAGNYTDSWIISQ